MSGRESPHKTSNLIKCPRITKRKSKQANISMWKEGTTRHCVSSWWLSLFYTIQTICFWKPILSAAIQRTNAQSLVFRSYIAIPNQIFRKRFFMITVGESKNNNQQKIWIANRIELQKISDFRYCFACFSLSFCTFGTEIVISIFNVRKGMPSQNSTDLLVVKRDLKQCNLIPDFQQNIFASKEV